MGKRARNRSGRNAGLTSARVTVISEDMRAALGVKGCDICGKDVIARRLCVACEAASTGVINPPHIPTPEYLRPPLVG